MLILPVINGAINLIEELLVLLAGVPRHPLEFSLPYQHNGLES